MALTAPVGEEGPPSATPQHSRQTAVPVSGGRLDVRPACHLWHRAVLCCAVLRFLARADERWGCTTKASSLFSRAPSLLVLCLFFLGTFFVWLYEHTYIPS